MAMTKAQLKYTAAIVCSLVIGGLATAAISRLTALTHRLKPSQPSVKCSTGTIR